MSTTTFYAGGSALTIDVSQIRTEWGFIPEAVHFYIDGREVLKAEAEAFVAEHRGTE